MISVNGEKINVTKFSDQTSQVWNVSGISGLTAVVVWNFELESEFLHLAQLKTLLDKKGIRATLHMPYLPYARQDKPVNNQNTFALITFAKLINDLKFEAVFAVDPHSEVPKELIKNFTPIIPFNYIRIAEIHTQSDVMCFPDKGAMTKYGKYFKPERYVYGEKVRNQQTGKLEDMKLVGDVKDKNVLIVDDICDGGGTFCWMAQLLYDAGAKSVNLYTTHGIFSKGLRPLREAKIERIFTKDGEISEYHKHIVYKPMENTEL